MQNYLRQPTSNMAIVTDISQAINGEYHAIHCYEQLANQTQNLEIKNRILEIRNDEIRHYHLISHIYTSLTGKQPTPKLTEQCADNFRSGVLASFKDEQETVDFYHKIARTTNDSFIRDSFQQAAADEQNHAVWFLYFMTHH